VSQPAEWSRSIARTAAAVGALCVAVLCVLFVVPAEVATASTDTVTTCAGSGAGSLPAVVAAASSGDTVTFSVDCPASSPITLSSTIDVGENLTIDGPGATEMAVSGNNAVEDFGIASGATVTLAGITVEDGNASQGGGISNSGSLTVTNSAVFTNEMGGGIHNTGQMLSVVNSSVSSNNSGTGAGGIDSTAGTVDITNSKVSDNTGSGGGGIYDVGAVNILDSTVSGNSAQIGGGLWNLGSATIVGSTFSGNSVDSGDGGGIANYGPLTLTSSTLSGNNANYGGGIENDSTLTVTGSTFSGNSASSGDGGGIEGGGDSFISLAATIVANSGNGLDCVPGERPISDGGYNLDDDGSCGFSASNHSLSDTDPYLGPLANNGGPTETQAPALGSPVLDQIPVGTTENDFPPLCPGTDQRGVPRPQGSECDIGAVELAVFTITSAGSPVPSLSETGTLPKGVKFKAGMDGMATLSGTPTKAGVSHPTIVAKFPTGSAKYTVSEVLTLTVDSQ
jgi:hypothetical protein